MMNVQEVPMKISLIRSGEVVEVRRRRLVNPSYEVVEKVASEVCSGKYRLQYTDEDGDVVTMSSQEEWKECLASWDGEKALQLRVELCGPRGLGRRGCRDRCRSRTPSPHRHHRHGHRSRNRSVSSGRSGRHHRWGRRSQSPPSSHDMPLAFPCAPNRFRASLAKMEQACCSNTARRSRSARSGRGRSLSRSVSPHRHHHGRHRRTRSLSAGCKRWARSLSPSWAQHMPLVAQVFQAWLAKARRHHGGGGAHTSCEAPSSSAVQPPTAGEKCANCDYQTTGLAAGFCCKKCMRGRGCHGRRCEQTPFVAKEQAASGSDDQHQQEEGPATAGARHPFLLQGFPFGGFCAGGKGMHGHGKGKGTKGSHRPCRTRTQQPDGAGNPADQPQGAEPEWGTLWKSCAAAALDGMYAHAEGVHGKGKGSKAGRPGGKGWPAPAPTEADVHRQATEDETPTGTCDSEGSAATGAQAEPCSAQEVEHQQAEETCGQAPAGAGLGSLSVSELRKLAKAHNVSTAGCLEKCDLTSLLQNAGVAPAAAADAAPSPAAPPSRPTEEEEAAAHPFARQLDRLAAMGFPVNPQLLATLAASSGDLAAVLAGHFAQQ